MASGVIYIHVPWCKRRCPYCDFYFEVGKPDGRFVQAIKAEFKARSDSYFTSPAQSLYFGGGTPSLLPISVIDELVQFFKAQGALRADAEITLEANPEDLLSSSYANDLAQAQVNRVSLGVQSFDDRVLKILGRAHMGAQAEAAISFLIHAGITNISVDLIVGVRGELPDQILATLDFLSSRVPHISAYLLTIEQNTHFSRQIEQKKMPPLDEDQQADIYAAVQKRLFSLGYEQYDISSYAREKRFSRHNQIYWGMGNYLGLGPSAHSLRGLADGGKERRNNQANLSAWLLDPTAGSAAEILDHDRALLESLAFGLRNMVVGIDPSELAQKHQTKLPHGLYECLKKFIDFGWLETTGQIYRLTPLGALFADAVMRDILCL